MQKQHSSGNINRKDKIFNIRSSKDFETRALEVFQFQAKNNKTYSKYINHLGITPVFTSSTKYLFYQLDFSKLLK